MPLSMIKIRALRRILIIYHNFIISIYSASVSIYMANVNNEYVIIISV